MHLKHIILSFALGVGAVLAEYTHLRGNNQSNDLELIDSRVLDAPLEDYELEFPKLQRRELNGGKGHGGKGHGGKGHHRGGSKGKGHHGGGSKHRSHSRRRRKRRSRKSRSYHKRSYCGYHCRRRRRRRHRRSSPSRRRYYWRKYHSSSSSSSPDYRRGPKRRRSDGTVCMNFSQYGFGRRTVEVTGNEAYFFFTERANPRASHGPCSNPDTSDIDQGPIQLCREFGGGQWRNINAEAYMEDYLRDNLAEDRGQCNLRNFDGVWTLTTVN